MKELIQLSIQQIRRRPAQSSILFASIALGSLLLASALGLLLAINEPFDQVFRQLKGSHFLLYFDQRTDDPEQLQTWFEKQPEVLAISPATSVHMQNGPFFLGENKLELGLRLVEYNRKPDAPDSLYILRGAKQERPDFGEIWINPSLGKTHGIQPGDSIGIPLGAEVRWLKVSAWVIDPHYASGMVNPGQAWVAAGALASMYSVENLQEVMLGLRLKAGTSMHELWDRFISEVGYDGSKLDQELFRSASGSLLGLIGNILLLVAFLSFLLSLLLIRNSLRANIQADFRQIGIWKSLGFIPREIQFSYLLQVLLLAVLGISLGLLSAKILLPLLLQKSLSNLGITQLQSPALPFFVAAFLKLTLILLLAWTGSRKAAAVPAAQAIRNGRPEKADQFHFFSFQNLHSPLSYFSAFLLQSRVFRNLMLLLSFALCIALMSILLSLGNSFSRLEEQAAAWGFEEVDLILKKSERVLISRRQKEIMDILEKEEGVEKVIPYDLISASIPAQRNASGRELLGKVYAENLQEAGLTKLQGKHPQYANELSLCIGTAQVYGISVGDSLEVELEGERIRMLVCGIYQDIGNMGQGFRLHASSILRLNPLFEVSLYGLKLKDRNQKEDLKQHIKQRYGEIFEFERSIGDIIRDMGVVSAIWGLVQFLCLFFLLIISLLYAFDLGLLFREEKGHFVLLQALGMERREIREVLLYRILLIFLPALLLGLLLGNSLGAMLISQISSGLGLPAFPYQINILHNLFLSLALEILLFALTYWRARRLPVLLS